MRSKSLLIESTPDLKGKRRFPWIYVPSIYFAEGLPWVLVNLVSVTMYATLGVSNSTIGLVTSNLAWAWTFKMLWSPYVDSYLTKRIWLIMMQFAISIVILLAAFSMQMDSYFVITVILFGLIAFLSATNDISIDGYYMLSLSKEQQAFFVGIRSLFYRISMIFGTGVLVFLAGIFEESHTIQVSWMLVLLIAGGLFLLISIFHMFYLPRYESPKKIHRQNKVRKGEGIPFVKVFRLYFTQNKIGPVIAFILLYRFGEAMISKMLPPFLINSTEVGGLGLSTTELGLIQGTLGITGLITGGILGGWLIYKFGLKKCIWPLAFALNLPNLLYIYLAYAKPDISIIYVIVGFEQFGYGLGFSSFMMFLIHVSKGEFKTSFYAISTGIMALGLNLPGMLSGFVQEWLGYKYFFILVSILTIPGMLTLFFIPLDDNRGTS
ncbi:MAG: AmpG family muropeptide MFS transporter [bacterium]|nr:AmpG family muropeptide MFS transporter [bacterium]